MFTPGNISISDFEYSLPTDRIASHPLSKRDESKLLIYRDGEIGSDVFKNIGNYLPEGSRLVLNNTKVVSARIIFLKETGATIEVFLLEPVFPADYSVSFSSHEPVVWKCMVGNQKRWKTDTLERTVPQTDTKLKVRKSKK
ncbi:MAG TPA: S-adenosylmethionine:tRNA ribosyltransferase-isomerase, partial [Tenuifilaceae bacterium]|nr:S-adenosylmethionine:tRNA ribosyltransferase-isomerase [Tenuifilaceae bacterium]